MSPTKQSVAEAASSRKEDLREEVSTCGQLNHGHRWEVLQGSHGKIVDKPDAGHAAEPVGVASRRLG